MASDGGAFAASLVDVAVRAAVQAGAPRRTVAATAAAVATAVMVAWRAGAGASGGAAAAPTASQLRRSKRKKKDAREALAAASRQPHDVEVAETMVHSGASDLSLLRWLRQQLQTSRPLRFLRWLSTCHPLCVNTAARASPLGTGSSSISKLLATANSSLQVPQTARPVLGSLATGMRRALSGSPASTTRSGSMS